MFKKNPYRKKLVAEPDKLDNNSRKYPASLSTPWGRD
jgi:hypothetical protein